MTNTTIRKKIKETLQKEGMLINKITLSGIEKHDDCCEVRKIIVSLDVPHDDDVATILHCRELLDEQGIVLVNVLLEL